MSRQQRAGFTLLETMAVVGITAFVIATVTTMYVSIMNNTERASRGTRDLRVASAVLDRIARDLEGAFLERREEDEDPLFHPWLFKAEARLGQAGADRLLFTTLSHSARGATGDQALAAGSATYAYWLAGDEELGYDLLRHVQAQLAVDHRFPLDADDGVAVVAEGLAGFSLHFLDEAGNWVEEWDSSTLVDSSELPVAVEARLLIRPIDADEAAFLAELGDEVEPREFRRRVVLYQRPLTETAALGLAGVSGGGGAEEEGVFKDESDGCAIMTFEECYQRQTAATLANLSEAEKTRRQLRRNKCVPETFTPVNLRDTEIDMNRCR